MSSKDTNKALAEQRRKQQELIELKKLQQAGGSIPNEPPKDVLTSPTSKIKNFWYYYKWYIFAFVVIFAALALLVKQCCDKVVYDYIVVLNSTEYVADLQIDKIEQELKKYAVDTNGDGEVNLMVMNCSRGEGAGADPSFNQVQHDKFQTQLLDGKARIFIMNDKTFQDANKQDYMLWTDHFALPEYDGKGISIDDTPLKDIMKDYKYDYFIGYRKSDSYETPDAQLFEMLINND